MYEPGFPQFLLSLDMTEKALYSIGSAKRGGDGKYRTDYDGGYGIAATLVEPRTSLHGQAVLNEIGNKARAYLRSNWHAFLDMRRDHLLEDLEQVVPFLDQAYNGKGLSPSETLKLRYFMAMSSGDMSRVMEMRMSILRLLKEARQRHVSGYRTDATAAVDRSNHA